MKLLSFSTQNDDIDTENIPFCICVIINYDNIVTDQVQVDKKKSKYYKNDEDKIKILKNLCYLDFNFCYKLKRFKITRSIRIDR